MSTPVIENGSEPTPEIHDARQARRLRRRLARKQFLQAYTGDRAGMVGLGLIIAFIAVAILAPVLADRQGLGEAFGAGTPLQPPSAEFPLGTDYFGRSVLTLLIWGARVSLVVGLAAGVITAIIGTAVGVIGGYAGGKTDVAMNALSNWFLVIPWVPLAIVLASIMGQSVFNVIIVIGITSWASTARLVRAQTLTVKERGYVERASALGATRRKIVGKHVLPNLLPVILANTVLMIALAILSDTTLAILGLGDPNTVSWGSMLDEAFSYGAITSGIWWWILPPGIAIVTVVLSFTMCGIALEKILDPRLRSKR